MTEDELTREWLRHEEKALSENRCPHSGLLGPECKKHLCDCFDYIERWGESQR